MDDTTIFDVIDVSRHISGGEIGTTGSNVMKVLHFMRIPKNGAQHEEMQGDAN